MGDALTPAIRLAYDAGPGVGLGHRRRMEALAAALDHLGHASELVHIDGGRVDGDVAVVDSYRHRADDPERFSAGLLVAVDDLERDLEVDLLVDPSPWARGKGLCGLDFALVDPSVGDHSPRPTSSAVESILVTCGGADAKGTGARVAASVRRRIDRAVAVRLALGPWGDQRVPDGVDAITTTGGLIAELARADVVVTGAGVTMLEALALGRPVIALPTGQGRGPYLTALGGAGTVVACSPPGAPDDVEWLVGDPARRERLSEAGRELVDGRGAFRVAEAVLARV